MTSERDDQKKDECVEMAKEEYPALRAEILQSISIQHQITLGGYAFTGAVAGYILGASDPVPMALAVLPLILFSMSCLWAVECNRMVRAGVYIANVLWPNRCATKGESSREGGEKTKDTCDYEGWEKWIRRDAGEPFQFTRRQNYLQKIVIVFVPGALSILSNIGAMCGTWQRSLCHQYILVVWFIACIAAWIWLYLDVRKITNLGYPKGNNSA